MNDKGATRIMLAPWCVLVALFAGVCSPLTADVLYTVTDIGISGRFASSDVFAINNAGQVTGTSRAGQAFLYDNGQVLELGRLASFPGASLASGGSSINDSGQITGYYSSSPFSPNLLFSIATDRSRIWALWVVHPTPATALMPRDR